MAAGMLDAGVDMGCLMSEKCNKLLTIVLVGSLLAGYEDSIGTVTSMREGVRR
jgi:hypothetical protein